MSLWWDKNKVYVFVSITFEMLIPLKVVITCSGSLSLLARRFQIIETKRSSHCLSSHFEHKITSTHKSKVSTLSK